MNRRGFLGALLGAATAEIWVPKLISIPKVLHIPQTRYYGVDFEYNSEDRLLGIAEFQKRYMTPAMMSIVDRIDRDLLTLGRNGGSITPDYTITEAYDVDRDMPLFCIRTAVKI